MQPLAESAIRGSFVNASKRESAQATLPELADVAWERLDYLGWRDAKRPLLSYVVLAGPEQDPDPVGVVLRSGARSAHRRKAVCVWCEDVVNTADVTLQVARRAGARGRRGDTVGTLVCTELQCSRNVRRTPSIEEVGSDDPQDRARLIARRIDGLRDRVTRFVVSVQAEQT